MDDELRDRAENCVYWMGVAGFPGYVDVIRDLLAALDTAERERDKLRGAIDANRVNWGYVPSVAVWRHATPPAPEPGEAD